MSHDPSSFASAHPDPFTDPEANDRARKARAAASEPLGTPACGSSSLKRAAPAAAAKQPPPRSTRRDTSGPSTLRYDVAPRQRSFEEENGSTASAKVLLSKLRALYSSATNAKQRDRWLTLLAFLGERSPSALKIIKQCIDESTDKDEPDRWFTSTVKHRLIESGAWEHQLLHEFNHRRKKRTQRTRYDRQNSA